MLAVANGNTRHKIYVTLTLDSTLSHIKSLSRLTARVLLPLSSISKILSTMTVFFEELYNDYTCVPGRCRQSLPY